MVATEVKNAGGAASVATCDVEDWWRVTWLAAPETRSSYLQMVGAHFGWFRDGFDKKGGGGQESCWMIKREGEDEANLCTKNYCLDVAGS